MESQSNSIMLLRKSLKRRLAPMRYEHSLSVSFTAMSLAMCHGYDLEKAELAGLLHDCGKRDSDEVILKKCLKRGIEVTDDERRAPSVLHAKYGAWLAQNRYEIQDLEILSAIRWHTTGKPDMSTLEKILYIADYIEPRRFKADNLPQMRALAFRDLDQTMYEILKGTLEYLEKKGGAVDGNTFEAYKFYQKAMDERGAFHGSV